MRNSLRVALLALGLSPGLALANNSQSPNAQTALCLELASTSSETLSLEDLVAKSKALLPSENETGKLFFVGKTKSADARLCYGPFSSASDAALAGIVWQKEQPLSLAKARIEGFHLVKLPKATPDKKGEVKLGDPVSFDLTDATFVTALRQKLGPAVRVGVIGTNKAYLFSKTDAWLPAKSEALAELEKGARLLTLGQERLCEESAGCLFWEKTLLGPKHKLAYLPAGQLVYPEEGILSPDGSWKLFVRPRAALPYTPAHFRNATSEPGSAEPCLSVAIWAQSTRKNDLDSLGTVEIPGSSTEGLLISFTFDGVLVQDSQGRFAPKALPIDLKKYPALPRPEAAKAEGDASNAASSAQAPTAAKPKPKYRVHRVRPGDTLWDLANKYGTTVEAIRRANRLSKKAVLQLNQKLLIPTKR